MATQRDGDDVDLLTSSIQTTGDNRTVHAEWPQLRLCYVAVGDRPVSLHRIDDRIDATPDSRDHPSWTLYPMRIIDFLAEAHLYAENLGYSDG